MCEYNNFIDELSKLLNKYNIKQEDVCQLFNITSTKLLIINLEEVLRNLEGE